jgi:hypothetical protein
MCSIFWTSEGRLAFRDCLCTSGVPGSAMRGGHKLMVLPADRIEFGLLVREIGAQLCDHSASLVEILLHSAQIGGRRGFRIELHESLDDAGSNAVALHANKIAYEPGCD